MRAFACSDRCVLLGRSVIENDYIRGCAGIAALGLSRARARERERERANDERTYGRVGVRRRCLLLLFNEMNTRLQFSTEVVTVVGRSLTASESMRTGEEKTEDLL